MHMLLIIVCSFLLGGLYLAVLSFVFKYISNRRNEDYNTSALYTLSFGECAIIQCMMLTFFGMFTVINLANATIVPIASVADFIMYAIVCSIIVYVFFILPFQGVYNIYCKKILVTEHQVIVCKLFSQKILNIDAITAIEKHYRYRKFNKFKNSEQRVLYEENYIYIFYHQTEPLFKVEQSMHNSGKFVASLVANHVAVFDNLGHE